MRSTLLAAFLLSVLARPASAGEEFHGFGELRFGMTVDEAIKALEKRIKVEHHPATADSSEMIEFPVRIAGQSYRGRAHLKDGRIHQIGVTLDLDGQDVPSEACAGHYADQLALLEPRYGAPDISRDAVSLGIYHLSVWDRSNGHLYLSGWSISDIARCYVSVVYNDLPFDPNAWDHVLKAPTVEGEDRF